MISRPARTSHFRKGHSSSNARSRTLAQGGDGSVHHARGDAVARTVDAVLDVPTSLVDDVYIDRLALFRVATDQQTRRQKSKAGERHQPGRQPISPVAAPARIANEGPPVYVDPVRVPRRAIVLTAPPDV